jgi:hypothetical protein
MKKPWRGGDNGDRPSEEMVGVDLVRECQRCIAKVRESSSFQLMTIMEIVDHLLVSCVCCC